TVGPSQVPGVRQRLNSVTDLLGVDLGSHLVSAGQPVQDPAHLRVAFLAFGPADVLKDTAQLARVEPVRVIGEAPSQFRVVDVDSGQNPRFVVQRQTRLVGGGHVHDRTFNGAGELPSGAFGNRTAGAAHGLPVEGGRVLHRTFNEAHGDFVRRFP